MNDTLNWPTGEFTLQAAVEQNSHLTEAVVRKKLSAATLAKQVVQTKKGDAKSKGLFRTAATAGC